MEQFESENKKGWFKENWFKLGLLGVAIAIAFALYQSWVVIPREKLTQQRMDKMLEDSRIEAEFADRERSRTLCFSLAQSEWSSTFELNSDPVLGKEEEGVRTWHSSAIRDSADRKLSDAKDLCIKQYPIN